MSQCDRVLAVLADHRWHLLPEIHEKAGTMRLNSRISELRRRGYVIDSLRRPPYGYRLVSAPEAGTWSCEHCGSNSYRHVTDDVFRCNGCQARVWTTLNEEGEPPRTADVAVVVSEASPSSLSAEGRAAVPQPHSPAGPASGAPRYHQLPFKIQDGHRRGAT